MSLFGGGHKSAAKTPTKALGIDFQGAQYGPPIPVVYGQNKVAGNCIWYGDFQAIAVQQKQSGGKGGGGSSSTTSYDYKASYQLGICEGPGSIVNVYNGTSTVSLASLGAVTSAGTQGQAAWSHLTGNYALGYSGTVLVSFQNRDLGSSASLPNDNFEVAGLCQYGSGIVDANPAAIITDLCTNVYHGINFGQMGDLTQYSNYCVASGIFLSPVYSQQQTAQQTLADLFKYTNADAWFSEGVLKVGCYADQSITGNGVTYTPNVTAVANLGLGDFITNGSEAPVTITRKSPADAMNIQRLEYVDRANTYHTSAVTATIDNDVVKSGARSDQSDTFHGITTAAVARLVAQNILQRKYFVRNQYAFQLSWRYCYLEPFDIVTLTDVNTGLSSFPVRILTVEEDEHGLLKFTAEEFPSGIGHGGTYATQPNAGTTVDPNSDPGPVAAPYLFRGPGFLVNNNKPEIWCAVTGNGNPLWAGCDVYLSHDGSSYTFLSTYARQARYGETTNSMGVQADPDTTSAPNVVLNGYNTQLLGGSQADADNFTTLAMIDNEIVSYETATLESGPSYTLSYLRRGAYGSTIAAHSASAPFVRLDDNILRIPVDPSQIGQTIYIKFLSRNCFGRTPRTLSGETAYTYVVGTNVELPDVPAKPDNFALQGVADAVSITWTNDNPAAVGCTSIERATASGGPWTVLAQVGPTTTAYHDSFTTGSTYYYRARARGPLVQSGWSAYTDVFSSTGVDVTTGLSANVQTLLNPQFRLGLNDWNTSTGWTSDATPRAVYTGFSGASGTYALTNTINVPCTPGAQIIAQALLSSTSANGNCYAGVEFLDSSLSHVGYAFGNTITGTTAATLSRKVAVAPTGAAFARFFLGAANCTSGTYYAQSCLMTVTLSTVDELPDGTGRFAVVNGAGFKGVSSVDTNNRAGIDFTQAIHVGKSLANIPDDSGSGRFAVANIDGNRRALIDATQAGHVGAWNLDSRVVDGTNFQRVGSGYADTSGRVVNLWDGTAVRSAVDTWDGSNRARTGLDSSGVLVPNLHPIDNLKDGTFARMKASSMTGNDFDFAKGGVNRNMGYVPDGGGRYGVHAVDGNNLALIDFSQGGHVNKNLDNIGDGGIRLATLQGLANSGSLLIDNANFLNGLAGWSPQSGSIYIQASSPAPATGAQYMVVASSASSAGSVITIRHYGCKAGDVISFGGLAYAASGVAAIVVAFYSPNGSFISQGSCSTGAAAWSSISGNVTVPTGASYFVLACQQTTIGVFFACFNYVWASTNDVRVAGSGSYGYVNFGDNVAGGHLGKVLDNIGDGTTYARILSSQLTNGQHNLEVAGSGHQLGDQRANLPVNSAGPVSNWRNLTISYTSSPTSATISVTAASIVGILPNAEWLNYNASSTTVSGSAGTSKTYYLYFNDPNFSGGTQVLSADTNGNNIYVLGHVYVGSVTVNFPSSGSGSGGGSGGLCVADEMFIGEGCLAGDAEIGDPFDCIDLPTQAGKHQRALQGVTRGTEECVRMITSDGCALVCSVSTPFDLPDGRATTAPRMLGEQVITDLGTATVISLALVGPRPVTRAHLGGVSYAAGADPARRIYSHNLSPVKP